MFRAWCAKYLLNERFTVGLVDRLRASSRLRQVCGFGAGVPSDATFSRFFRRLASIPALAEDAAAQVVERIRARLPDVGADVSVDSTDVQAHAHPDRSDTDATWGFRTTKPKSGVKKDAELFFGYKLHTLMDATHGVPLAHIVLPANENDSPQLSKLVDRARALYPWLKPKHLLADRGYDSIANHKALVKRGITPIIHVRKPTAEDGLYDGIYAAKGQPACTDGKTPMQYLRTDAKTGHHLFRCPPAGCAMKAKISGLSSYCDGTELWVDPFDNLRAIGLVARAGAKWQRLYARRQGIERMFGSLKRSRLLNQHLYVWRDKVELHLGLAILTYLATMLTRLEAGDGDRIRHMRIKVG